MHAWHSSNLGVFEIQKGNNENAAALLEKAVAVFEKIGDVVNAQKARRLLNQARSGGRPDMDARLKDPTKLLRMLEAADGISAEEKEQIKAILLSTCYTKIS